MQGLLLCPVWAVRIYHHITLVTDGTTLSYTMMYVPFLDRQHSWQ